MTTEGRTLVASKILFLCKQYSTSQTATSREASTYLSKRTTIVIAHCTERCPFSGRHDLPKTFEDVVFGLAQTICLVWAILLCKRVVVNSYLCKAQMASMNSRVLFVRNQFVQQISVYTLRNIPAFESEIFLAGGRSRYDPRQRVDDTYVRHCGIL